MGGGERQGLLIKGDNMKKINLHDLNYWSGDDSKEDVLKYLLSILNKEFSIDEAREEILDFIGD
jgi:hypothetical protein